MKAGAVPGTIRIATPVALDLKRGERVSVQVLKVLADGKWAVGLKGRVFAARSPLPLEAGDRVAAVVERAGRHIVLRLAGGEAAAPPAPAAAGALAEAVARALLREGLPADEPTVRRLVARARGAGGPERKTSRSLAIALSKGIDPDSPGMDGLLSFLHFEDNPDRGGYRRRKLPPREAERAAAVKAELARESGDGALGLFNALRGDPRGEGHWIAIPFSFSHEGRGLEGTARFLYAGGSPRPVKMALDVTGRSRWSFLLSQRPGTKRLEVFSEGGKPRERAQRALAALRAKLQSRGVEVDDSISDRGVFDGYSAERMGGGVDLEG